MFLLISLVGILSMLLVVTASVAYLALRRGRLCPHCGGSTNPVVLRRFLRLLSPWLQWRWCSRCGWEGPGRRGPDLGPLDPPADPGSGFRWGASDSEDIPIFHWKSDPPSGEGKDRPDHPSGEGKDRPDHPSGFRWQSSAEPMERAEPERPGFDFGPPRGDEAASAVMGTEEEPRTTDRGCGATSGRTPMVLNVASVQGTAGLSLEGAGGLGRSRAFWNRHGPEGSDGLR